MYPKCALLPSRWGSFCCWSACGGRWATSAGGPGPPGPAGADGPASPRPDEVHDPVGLPRPAAVRGERLLPAAGGRRDVGPDVADEDGPAVDEVLVEELAASVGERPDRRPIEPPLRAVRPVQAPLPGVPVVEAEG